MIFGTTNNVFIQFFRYFWVGASSAIVDILVFSFCLYTINTSWWIAAVVGYGFGIIWNYCISILWVFKSSNMFRELVLVFCVGAGGIILTWILLYICINWFGIHELLSKMISQIIILGWNFSLRKWFVF